MSEAEQLKNSEQGPEQKNAAELPQAATPARSVNGVAWLALLLAFGSAAVVGWQSWQAQQLPPVAPVNPVDEATQQALAQLQAEQQSWQQRFQTLEQTASQETGLEKALTDLQGMQQRQALQLDRLQNNGRNELRLAEAEHLLRLASLRLSALEDVASAKALLTGADDLLREQNDPTAFAARRELAKVLEALQVRAVPDRSGLYMRLAALRTELLKLTAEVPSYQTGEPEAAQDEADEGRWQRWWQQLSGFVRIDFSSEHDIRPLLAGQQLDQVRLALTLSIEQAQWAVLNGEQAVYQQALQQAEEILQSQFGASRPQVQALSARLKTLATEHLSFEVPDMTAALEAFSAYLKQHQNAAPSTEVSQ